MAQVTMMTVSFDDEIGVISDNRIGVADDGSMITR